MTVSQWGRTLVDEIEGADIPERELWIWPLGGPSLCVRSRNATIYIDPFTGSPAQGPWIRMVAVPFDPADLRMVDAVFSTHEHDDHCHEDTLRPIVENTSAPLIGPASSAKKMLRFGFPGDRVVEAVEGREFTFGDLSVRAETVLDHSDPASLGWLVSVDGGPSLFDGGDSMYGIHFASIGEKRVDAATLSVAGLADGRKIYMDPDECIRAAKDLGVRMLIPKHWDLWRNVYMDPWEVVLAGQRGHADFGIRIPRLGEAIRLQ